MIITSLLYVFVSESYCSDAAGHCVWWIPRKKCKVATTTNLPDITKARLMWLVSIVHYLGILQLLKVKVLHLKLR